MKLQALASFFFFCLPLFVSAQLYSVSATEVLVYYNSDSYELRQEDKLKITETILKIGSTNIREMFIEGHTDSFATDSYNVTLAANRAQSVVGYLGEMGFSERFLKIESFGESKLLSSNDHARNRRARLYIIHETNVRNAMYPPKFIRVRCIDKNSKKPLVGSVGFEYGNNGMKFSTTDRSGFTPVLPILEEELEIIGTADRYLSKYLKVSQQDLERPADTLIYTLELIPVQVVGKFTFDNIYFFTDSDEFKPESQPDLYKLLAILQNNTSAYIEIQGHMNYPINRPNNSLQRRYNLELSYKRAKAVNDYLVRAGIEQTRLTYKGMSNSRMKFPLPNSRVEEDKNKRVEIYTLKERKR